MRAPEAGPEVLTFTETAELLGVSDVTLRRWARSGRFSPHGGPVNGYRCYRPTAAQKLGKLVETGTVG